RHAADQVETRGQEAVVRTAVRGGVACRLAFADGDRATVASGSFEKSERERIHVCDGKRTRVSGGRGEIRSRLQAPEEVGLLEDHRGGVLRRFGEEIRIGRPAAVRNL